MTRLSNQTARITRYGSASPRYAPTYQTDRAIDCLTVQCPECAADIGERCSPTRHAVRRRMAVRLLNENGTYDTDALARARNSTLRERRRAIKASGLSYVDLAKLIGVEPRVVGRWQRGGVPNGPGGARYGEWLASRAAADASAELTAAPDHIALPTCSEAQAAARGLVTLSQIARACHVTTSAVRALSFLPAPTARLDARNLTYLYSASEVMPLIAARRPHWLSGETA